jgi:predicted nucleic acid-binding protein
MPGLVLDTDVLIDFLRGRTEAVGYLESVSDELLTSVVTVAELFAGVREGEERRTLEELLEEFRVVPVTREVAELGGLHRRDYRKSHNIQLADALIAATVEQEQATLVTLNDKHFPMLKQILVPYRKA